MAIAGDVTAGALTPEAVTLVTSLTATLVTLSARLVNAVGVGAAVAVAAALVGRVCGETKANKSL